mgnify:CR=1 FL=1
MPLRSGPRRFAKYLTISLPWYLVKQTRHVVFFHKGTSRGQALRGELFGRDAGAKDFLGRADGGDRAALLGRKGLDACVLVVVLVLSSDVLKFIKR